MAASKKEGGKNRKIGRHSRAPSNTGQKQRTARNKAKRAQRITHVPAAAPRPRVDGVQSANAIARAQMRLVRMMKRWQASEAA